MQRFSLYGVHTVHAQDGHNHGWTDRTTAALLYPHRKCCAGITNLFAIRGHACGKGIPGIQISQSTIKSATSMPLRQAILAQQSCKAYIFSKFLLPLLDEQDKCISLFPRVQGCWLHLCIKKIQDVQ